MAEPKRRRGAPAPVDKTIRQPLGRRYEGQTVPIQYVGGGELTLRSRAVAGAIYNFSRGSVVAVAAEDAPRFLNNKDFRRHEAKAAPAEGAAPPPEAPASSPAANDPAAKADDTPTKADVPTFPDKK